MSIASELTTLANNKAAIKAAIEAKNPSVMPGNALADWPDSIASIQSGGGNYPATVDDSKDVVFIDHHGVPIYSYTKAEALALTDLPEEPNIEGFDKDGWNYTLAEMKDQVTNTGQCVVGAHYVPSDGKNHMFVVIENEYQREWTNFRLIEYTSGNDVTVEWGDGQSDTITSTATTVTFTHTYNPSSYPAYYEIKFTCSSTILIYTLSQAGSNAAQSSFDKCGRIIKLNLGRMYAPTAALVLQYKPNLMEITMPRDMPKYSSSSITLVTVGCYALPSVSIPRCYTNVTTNTTDGMGLRYISIPPTTTSITVNLGHATHSSLRRFSIPYGPSVTSVSYKSCGSLCRVDIPPNVTSVDCYGCYNLHVIILPSTVASITSQAFYNCKGLAYFRSYGVTSIGDSAFYGCYGCAVFDFSECAAVPSLSNVNAFQYTSTTKKIVVPDSLYNNWIAASNWSSTTNNIKTSIIKKSDFDAL